MSLGEIEVGCMQGIFLIDCWIDEKNVSIAELELSWMHAMISCEVLEVGCVVLPQKIIGPVYLQ